MDEEQKALEERMTPEERELYQSFKERIGQESIPQYNHDIFLPLLGEGEVTWSLIKKWAQVHGDLNPLWFDEEYAKQSRWKGIIAPPMFTLTIDPGKAPAAYPIGFLYKPAPNPVLNLEKYPTFRGSSQSDSEWEFFEPIRPGDTISVKTKFSDIYWKQGKRFRLLFTAGETTYTNHRGQLVARCRLGAVYMFK